MDIESYLSSYIRNDYQRDNFDAFLRKVDFKFTKPAIHIAGTNGKGSTASYIYRIYIENGYKTGIFSTPDTFEETIKINDKSIGNKYVEDLIKEYEKLFKKFDLSTFEIQTFIALKYFEDQDVDIAIIECGMGGELDATNVFIPVLSIITTINIEHSMFLGESLSAIAAHKAGIIKEGVPALIGKVDGDALDVIVSKCKYENSDLVMVDSYHHYAINNDGATFDYRPYLNIKILSQTEYSAFAACLAIEATNILKNMFHIKEELLKSGLYKMKLKARFEKVIDNPIIICDGAHNPEAILQLRKEFDRLYPGRRAKILFASFMDKSIANMLPEINLVGDIILTTFDHPRARKEDDYFIYLSDYKFEEDYKKALLQLMETEELILVTGSLAFAYEVRKYLLEHKNEKL